MNNSTFLGSAHINDGYNGHEVWVYFVEFQNNVYEIHSKGFHTIPPLAAMSKLIDQAHLEEAQ
tara:strand:+ start:157 stop:345 length:189 start_codon:yes stop_codon:yes gene_type:complete